MRKHDDTIQAVNAVADQIRPLLAGKPPEVVGTALAEIVSIYFAGHNPTIREKGIEVWISLMRKLIPPNEAMILESTGKTWDDINRDKES